MLELADLSVTSMTDATDCAVAELPQQLRREDARWEAQVASARARGERLVVLAEADHAGGRIALRSLPEQSAFASLQPGQNLIVIKTDLQDRMPLSVSGPGAGVEITAAGVLSDVVAIASYRR
jgi:aspartokinase/homoserine dehydrogenase 1